MRWKWCWLRQAVAGRSKTKLYPSWQGLIDWLVIILILLLRLLRLMRLYYVEWEGEINNNTNSTVYATINLGYTICFDPNGSSSGVSSYTLFTYCIATWDSHIYIYIHRSWSDYALVYLHTVWGYWLLWEYCINLTFKLKLFLIFSWI
jgi:hypothetical protein